ncbi:glycosyltransferase [Thermodesulfobacteriota bacterium]
MRNHKRLLILTSTFPRWKEDEDPPFVYELCRHLKQHFDIHVLAPYYPGARKEERFAGLYVTRYRYFFRPWERLAYQGGILATLRQKPLQNIQVPFFLLAQLFALIRLLRRYRFDLIHAHWLLPQGFIAVLARLFIKSPPPLLCTSHGGDLFGLQGSLLNRIKRFVVSHSTALTVVSHALRDEVIKLGAQGDKVHVIPMGTDLQKLFVPPETRTNNGSLLFVGRLVEKKGLRYLIDALPMILKRHPHASLQIAGDGPEKTALARQVTELGLNDRVKFLGSMKKESLPQLYRSSDVVIFPSVIAEGGDREGFGLVLVEALGCECATVTTDLPAMRDIIVDGKTGLVVPQKNVQKLARGVISLLDDPALRRKLGKEGRGYVVKRYDWDIIARQYASLIDSIT